MPHIPGTGGSELSTPCSLLHSPQQPQCKVKFAVKRRRNTWQTTWESEVILLNLTGNLPNAGTILTFAASWTFPCWPLSPPLTWILKFTFYSVDSPEDWMCSFQRPYFKIVPYTCLSCRQWRVVRNAWPSDTCGLVCVSLFEIHSCLDVVCLLLKKFSIISPVLI